MFASRCFVQNPIEVRIREQSERDFVLERRRVVEQRCGQPKGLEGLGDSELNREHSIQSRESRGMFVLYAGDLRRLCEEYQKRIVAIENSKYDIEKAVEKKAYKIDELNIAVSDLRGKL